MDKIKTICLILLLTGIPIWSFYIWGSFTYGYENVYERLEAFVFFACSWLGSSLILSLLYFSRKIWLKPFQCFWQLTFERKMMLLVVIAILIAVSFYCWSVWEKQKYFQHKRMLERIESQGLPRLPGL